MICPGCAEVSRLNRGEWDSPGPDADYVGRPHPTGCGCACKHRQPSQWEKMFDVERPK